MTMKAIGITFCIIALGLSSCKSRKSCDAYSRQLIIQLDSAKAELVLTKDSLRRYDEYIAFLEADNQLLGSAMACIDIEKYPKTDISKLEQYTVSK